MDVSFLAISKHSVNEILIKHKKLIFRNDSFDKKSCETLKIYIKIWRWTKERKKSLKIQFLLRTIETCTAV
jgi:hypothetical protein